MSLATIPTHWWFWHLQLGLCTKMDTVPSRSPVEHHIWNIVNSCMADCIGAHNRPYLVGSLAGHSSGSRHNWPCRDHARHRFTPGILCYNALVENAVAKLTYEFSCTNMRFVCVMTGTS